MPTDEFGDKWACEPCIRGHRSTKCEHFDRFMMRVKRPGRPLSTCPHTKSQCTCGTEKVIMIRIPKGSGCHCTRAPTYPGGPDREGADPPQSVGNHAPPNPQLAPAPPPMTSGQGLKRINRSPEPSIDPELSKSSRNRPGSKAVFTGGKERRSGPSLRAQSATPSSELSMSSRVLGSESQELRALATAAETGDRSEYSIHTAEKENGPSRAREVQGAAVFEKDAPEVEKAESSKTPTTSNCCCNNPRESTPPAEPEVRQQETSSPHPFSPLIGPITTSFYQDSYSRPTMAGSDKSKSPEDSSYPQGFAHFRPIPQTTVYSMPATYATAENPLTARQQEYFQRNSHVYSQQVPHYAPLGVIGSAAPPAEGTDILSLSHNCTCGPSCQCVFCVAHPYNEPTRDRVQSLAHLLSDEGEYGPKSPLQPSYGSPFHSAVIPSSMTSTSHRMHLGEILHPSNLPQSRAFSSGDFGGPIYPELPSGSLAEAQQPAASSSGYLTMAYDYDPMQLGRCTDATGTCRCGDSCTCVGCLIHSGHDGDLL